MVQLKEEDSSGKYFNERYFNSSMVQLKDRNNQQHLRTDLISIPLWYN